MVLLITGGAGFIGSNFIRYILSKNSGIAEEIEIINLDNLTYAGNLENLAGVDQDPRYHFIKGDICDPADVEKAMEGPPSGVEAVVHFAAESHVDRSIEDASVFLRTNALGTQTLLEAARRKGIAKFIHISTDEVYGSLGPEGAFTEESPLAPSSPYAASKAAADLLALAYFRTYGLPVCITRCSNNYGPRQFPEKLIPLMISNALSDEPLPIYGDGLNIRDWIYVEDHCRGIMAALRHGRPGEIYNLGGGAERTNLEVVRTILTLLGKSEGLIRFVKDRPGHDRRYAMDITKAKKALGWSPQYDFEQGLAITVKWYLENQDWVNCVRSGAYRDYYQKMYTNRAVWIRRVGIS